MSNYSALVLGGKVAFGVRLNCCVSVPAHRKWFPHQVKQSCRRPCTYFYLSGIHFHLAEHLVLRNEEVVYFMRAGQAL